MSRADDLLNDLTDEEQVLRLADEAIEPNIVIGEDRFITVPEELQKIAVQYDHRIETVTFDCPRYWDGADMSKMNIFIHYTRSDGLVGMYSAKNVVVDETDPSLMHFDWTLTRNATGVDGKLIFLVSINRVDKEGNITQYWSSEENDDMYISPGMNNAETVRDKYPDIFAQIVQDSREAVEAVEAAEERINKRADEIETTVAESEARINQRTDEIEDMQNDTYALMQEINKIATPEAMQDYVVNYYEDNPTVALDAIEEVFNAASNDDIDSILAGTYKTTPGVLEDTYGLATNPDIDAIIGGTYVETEDDSGGGGGSSTPTPDDGSGAITDNEIDNIINNLF